MLEYPLSSKLLALFSGSFYGTAQDSTRKESAAKRGGADEASKQRDEKGEKKERREFEEREREEEEEEGRVLGAKTEEGEQEEVE